MIFTAFVGLLLGLVAVLLLLRLASQSRTEATALYDSVRSVQPRLDQLERLVRDEISHVRAEQSSQAFQLRTEILSTLTGISQLQKQELSELRSTVDQRLEAIRADNQSKLEQMRQTVEEKLQGTLEARLGESFRQVSERLEQVHRGLGEMHTLAAGVGDLKRVLTNVKTRGAWGEVQLGALLEQMLAPDQFERNVSITGSAERVEFAIKLPGRDDGARPVLLPIDAKFPLEDYLRLVEASERADADAVEKASRGLDAAIRACAKTISEKYISPPLSTDFAIFFLSTEALYAEVVRRTGLVEGIQNQHRVIVAGPSTLAALLNSLQMGFRTLAIQKRSSEVWMLLGAVKTEFGKYATALNQVRTRLEQAQKSIEVAGKRAENMQQKLRNVEAPLVPLLPDTGQLQIFDSSAEPEE